MLEEGGGEVFSPLSRGLSVSLQCVCVCHYTIDTR